MRLRSAYPFLDILVKLAPLSMVGNYLGMMQQAGRDRLGGDDRLGVCGVGIMGGGYFLAVDFFAALAGVAFLAPGLRPGFFLAGAASGVASVTSL